MRLLSLTPHVPFVARLDVRWRPPPSVRLAALVAAVGSVVALELASYGRDPRAWDLLFVSGVLTLAVAVWLARDLGQRFEVALVRLTTREVLRPPKRVKRARDDILRSANAWAGWMGAVGALGLSGAFAIVNAARSDELGLLFTVGGPIVGGVGGLVAGRPIGRMIGYSLISSRLKAHDVEIVVSPGHIDQAAGFKPLGDFFFRQALLLAIPAAFLLAWTVLFFTPAFSERYGAWRDAYLGLLVTAIIIEVLAFVAPLWGIHQVMRRCKEALLPEADQRATEIRAIRAKLEREIEGDERTSLRDLLSEQERAYEAIDKMPTWPIDPSVRRRFTLGNAGLVLSVATQTIALAGFS